MTEDDLGDIERDVDHLQSNEIDNYLFKKENEKQKNLRNKNRRRSASGGQ
jgi:hypothetical protein